MKTKLMQTKDYLFLIDLESKVKEGDTWIVDIDSKSIIPILGNTQIVKEGILKNWFVKILGYYPLTQETKELEGIPFLPNPFSNKYLKVSPEDVKKAFIAGMEFIPVDHSRYDEDANNYLQSNLPNVFPKDFLPMYHNNIIQVQKFSNFKEELFGKYIF